METRVAEQLLERPALDLALVDVNSLPRLWDQIEPLLVRACDHSGGAFTSQSVVDGLMEGRLAMLALAEGERVTSIMIVRIADYGSGLRVFECVLVGGADMDAWMPFEPRMDELARQAGCHRVIAMVRKGLIRKLPHWKLAAYVVERDLNDG